MLVDVVNGLSLSKHFYEWCIVILLQSCMRYPDGVFNRAFYAAQHAHRAAYYAMKCSRNAANKAHAGHVEVAVRM
jgi:hypothetical protein